MRASLGVLLGGLVAAQQVHLAALSATPLQCDAQAAAKWNGANGAEPNNFTRGATENLRAVKAAFNHLAYHGQDIKFFLAEGSLLGWYRQCMPIPWDTDLDIGVMIDDLHLGVGFLKEAMREQGFVLAGEVGTKAAGLTFIFFRESGYLQEETARSTAHGMVRTDIHFFYKDTKTNQFYLQIFNGDTTYRNSYDAFELRPAEGFGGVHLHVPHPAERYLEQIYGDFMKPRKDSQHMVAGEALNITDVAWDHLESAKNVKADDTASFLESMRWKPLGPAATVRAIVKFCGGWFPFVTGVTVASLMAYLAYQRNVQHSRARQEVSEKANAKKSKKLEEYRRGELNRMRADRLQRETEQAKQQAAKRQLVAERKAKEEEELAAEREKRKAEAVVNMQKAKPKPSRPNHIRQSGKLAAHVNVILGEMQEIIDVSPTETVGALKGKLAQNEHFGQPQPNKQILIFGGRKLSDDSQLLSEAGIMDGNTVHIALVR